MKKVVTNDAHSIVLPSASSFFFSKDWAFTFLSLLCQWHRFMSTFLALHGSLLESVFFFIYVCIHDADTAAAATLQPE